jgi:hypothetical protein
VIAFADTLLVVGHHQGNDTADSGHGSERGL